MPGASKFKTCRIVPPFTIQSLQRGTCVIGPPRSDFLKTNPSPKNNFQYNYKAGKFPIIIEANGNVIWKVLMQLKIVIFHIIYGNMSYYELITFVKGKDK